MTDRRLNPTLPRLRIGARDALLEMEINDILGRVTNGTTTVRDALVLRRTLAVLLPRLQRIKAPC